MLLVVSLDSESQNWLDEQLDSGALPNLSHLARIGTRVPVASVALAGVAYPTLYSGLRPAQHGLHFPVEWSPNEQRVCPWSHAATTPSVFERADGAGARVVVLDPPECPPQHLTHGFAASGIQFRSRVLLPSWSSAPARHALLSSLVKSAPRADEVFGRPSESDLASLQRALLGGPARLAAASLEFLRADPPDCLWVTCCGMHVAAHQFFDLGLLPDSDARRQLETTRLAVARGYDAMLGDVLSALPAGSDVVVFYAKGMDRTNGWVDLLPAMLSSVLGGAREAAEPVSRLRQLVPRSLRSRVATLLSDDMALSVMARLSTPRADWSRTRAFVLPSDGPGFIRFNLSGRERHGIVPEAERRALTEEIRAGLASFTDLDGEPCVQSVREPEELYGMGTHITRFPDLLVFWNQKPTLRGGGVRSPKFGEFRRVGVSTGRSGNHAPGSFALLVPGRSQVTSSAIIQPEDIPATLLSALGLPHNDLPGQSRLRR